MCNKACFLLCFLYAIFEKKYMHKKVIVKVISHMVKLVDFLQISVWILWRKQAYIQIILSIYFKNTGYFIVKAPLQKLKINHSFCEIMYHCCMLLVVILNYHLIVVENNTLYSMYPFVGLCAPFVYMIYFCLRFLILPWIVIKLIS